MTLTSDQKKALLIAGGIAILVIAWLLTRGGSVIPTATDVKPSGTFNSDPPGYTTYNVQPLSIPAPGVSNAIIPQSAVGCGCGSANTGCFSSDPLATGQGPLSLSQLMAQYGPSFSQFADLVKASQEGYAVPAPNILEMTTASCLPIGYNIFGAPDRFAALSAMAGQCWSPGTNGF